MRVEKNGITKEVDNALVPDYVTAGWKKIENQARKEVLAKPSEEKDDLDAKLQGK